MFMTSQALLVISTQQSRCFPFRLFSRRVTGAALGNGLILLDGPQVMTPGTDSGFPNVKVAGKGVFI